MGALLSVLTRAWFAVTLLIPMALVAGILKVLQCVPMDKQVRAGYSLMLVQAAWRISLALSPWLWITAHGEDFAENMRTFSAQVRARGRGEPGAKPVFLLGNHTSFLDTLLTVSRLSMSSAYWSRTYMSNHLFGLPILSTICRACDHFPVHFKGKGDTDFSVDKAKIAETQKLVDAHIERGGLLCFFPEGAMNKDPSKVMPVRYGGMKKALQYDAKLWTFITCGNHVMWPRKAPIGGFPGYGQYAVRCLAPDGCKALVQRLRDTAASEEEKAKSDHQLLSEYVHRTMQNEYDKLVPGSSTVVDKSKLE